MVTLRTGRRLCTPVWIKPKCSSPLFQIRCSRAPRMRGWFVSCANSTRLQKLLPLPTCLHKPGSFSTQALTTSTFRVCTRQVICSKPCVPPGRGCSIKNAPRCAKSCAIAAKCSPKREPDDKFRDLYFVEIVLLSFLPLQRRKV